MQQNQKVFPGADPAFKSLCIKLAPIGGANR
jgi:hypothetical protein